MGGSIQEAKTAYEDDLTAKGYSEKHPWLDVPFGAGGVNGLYTKDGRVFNVIIKEKEGRTVVDIQFPKK